MARDAVSNTRTSPSSPPATSSWPSSRNRALYTTSLNRDIVFLTSLVVGLNICTYDAIQRQKHTKHTQKNKHTHKMEHTKEHLLIKIVRLKKTMPPHVVVHCMTSASVGRQRMRTLVDDETAKSCGAVGLKSMHVTAANCCNRIGNCDARQQRYDPEAYSKSKHPEAPQ